MTLDAGGIRLTKTTAARLLAEANAIPPFCLRVPYSQDRKSASRTHLGKKSIRRWGSDAAAFGDNGCPNSPSQIVMVWMCSCVRGTN